MAPSRALSISKKERQAKALKVHGARGFLMRHSRYSTEEIATRGREIYEKRLRDKLEPDNIGKFLVIDIETGEYEMDEDDLAASMRAYEKKPDGARFGMRIGYRSSGSIGGKRPRRTA
jgi:hypothetical protein